VRLIKRPVKKTPRKKLRAAAQRSAKYAEEEYSAEEPNVKLSRAFVVVLLLHVVAVGGIFAFSALKDQQTGGAAGKGESANGKAASSPAKAARDPAMAEKSGNKAISPDLQKLVDSTRLAGAGGGKAQYSNAASEGSGDGGKSYVVQKGDSPAGIAKKFKVSYADLLKVNNIEDPKKLQIGQKLVIP
jgi:nucleoid-associated protein YgaU